MPIVGASLRGIPASCSYETSDHLSVLDSEYWFLTVPLALRERNLVRRARGDCTSVLGSAQWDEVCRQVEGQRGQLSEDVRCAGAVYDLAVEV